MDDYLHVYSGRGRAATQLDRYARIEHVDPDHFAYSVYIERQNQRKAGRALLLKGLKGLAERLLHPARRIVAKPENDFPQLQGCIENCE